MTLPVPAAGAVQLKVQDFILFEEVECVTHLPLPTSLLLVPEARVPNKVPDVVCGDTSKPYFPEPEIVFVAVTWYTVPGTYPAAGMVDVIQPLTVEALPWQEEQL